MANVGTRIHKIGSIYSRVSNMLKSGVLRKEQKPLWYDIYEAFPPIREPVYVPDPTPDENGLITVEDNVRPILYKEDWARASFRKFYGSVTSVYDFESSEKNETERFIQAFLNLQKQFPELSKEEVFSKTEDKMIWTKNKYH